MTIRMAEITKWDNIVSARKWGQEDANTLLVGVTKGTHPLKNGLAVSHRVKHSFNR